MTVVITATGEATRDRILRLADALFARHGYANVSMRAVALAAGVTKPALYYHFRDKEALFEECVLNDQERLGDRLRGAAADDGSLRERTERAARVLLTGSPHHPVRTQSDIAEHLPLEVRQRLSAGFARNIIGPVQDLFAAAAREGTLRRGMAPAVAAAALLGLAMAFIPSLVSETDQESNGTMYHVDGAGMDPDRAAWLVADLALMGVAG